MAGKNTAVFGIYKSAMAAERAVDRIIAAGFSNNDISVLLPDTQSSKEFAHEKNTKAPEGTTTGRNRWRRGRRSARPSGWYRCAGDTWRRAVHCSRPHHGRS